MIEVNRLFRQRFGTNPTVLAKAPGRLELLGNHTDYNQGLVLSIAVDRYVSVAAEPRRDGRIELVSAAFPGAELFPIDRLEKNPAAPWADYVKGILHQLRSHGGHFLGFNAAIHSTIPIGAGMSSSAALLVAAALVVRRLYPFRIQENGKLHAPDPTGRDEVPPL